MIKLEDNLQTLLFLFPLGHGTWRVFRYPVGSIIARQDRPSLWVGLSGSFQFLGRSFLAVGPEDLPIFSVMLLCLDTPLRYVLPKHIMSRMRPLLITFC